MLAVIVSPPVIRQFRLSAIWKAYCGAGLPEALRAAGSPEARKVKLTFIVIKKIGHFAAPATLPEWYFAKQLQRAGGLATNPVGRAQERWVGKS
jgi:hypothetical protein